MSTALILVAIAVCFSVAGELLLKSGMNRVGILTLSSLGLMIPKMLRTWQLYGGLASITLGAAFWLAATSRVELSWAYPLLAMGYILMLLFSGIVLGEHISLLRWIGTIIIVLGVILVSRS